MAVEMSDDVALIGATQESLDQFRSMAAYPDVIGAKRKVVILFHLTHDGTHRFAELRHKIPGVSERMLTQQLRKPEDDGIVHREVYPEVPPKVEYSLTNYGKSLRPITEVMCEWGQKHIKRLKAKKKQSTQQEITRRIGSW
jgi:DNA-binding HxlR family transcriptional regulator